jgi:hypothetical protein
MTVGKAEAQHPDRASSLGFRAVVPCLTAIDPPTITKLRARDQCSR